MNTGEWTQVIGRWIKVGDRPPVTLEVVPSGLPPDNGPDIPFDVVVSPSGYILRVYHYRIKVSRLNLN